MTLTKKKHTQSKNSDEQQFFDTVVNCTKDADIIKYCTEYVPMDEDGLRPNDRLFYKELGGPKSLVKKQVLNAMMNVYVLNLKQKNGNEYQPSSWGTKLNRLLKVFKDKGLADWKVEEFGGKGEWYAMLCDRWEKILEEDNTFARKKVAETDPDADLKVMNALREGKLKPYEDHEDLMRMLIAGLGRCLGYRGGEEMTKAVWSQFEFSEPTSEILIPHVWGAPGGGFDKTHVVNLKNTYVREDRPYVVDDPTNQYSFYKLLKYYRAKCHPDQVRLFCRLHNKLTPETAKLRVNPKDPYGMNPIARFAKEVALVCDFKDFQLFAAHGFRRQLISTSINNDAPAQMRQQHDRHQPESELPYHRPSRNEQMRHQIAIRVGSTGTGDTTLLHAAAGLQQQPQQQQQPMMDVTGLQQNNVSVTTMMQQQQQQPADGMLATGNMNENAVGGAGSNVTIAAQPQPQLTWNGGAVGSDAAQQQQLTDGQNTGRGGNPYGTLASGNGNGATVRNPYAKTVVVQNHNSTYNRVVGETIILRWGRRRYNRHHNNKRPTVGTGPQQELTGGQNGVNNNRVWGEPVRK